MIDRNEYPRPQFVRNEWVCLNGKWEFEIDQGDSGLERGLLKRKLKDHINIPSALNLNFQEAIRTILILYGIEEN